LNFVSGILSLRKSGLRLRKKCEILELIKPEENDKNPQAR
jgi:hypothetical protein